MKSTICSFNAELAEAKNMIVENQTLLILGTRLSKINAINKRPPSLDADRFYAMSQAVMMKSSPESICLGDG